MVEPMMMVVARGTMAGVVPGLIGAMKALGGVWHMQRWVLLRQGVRGVRSVRLREFGVDGGSICIEETCDVGGDNLMDGGVMDGMRGCGKLLTSFSNDVVIVMAVAYGGSCRCCVAHGAACPPVGVDGTEAPKNSYRLMILSSNRMY
jgi:hypothetical protein